MINDLNASVEMVKYVPRVRFDADIEQSGTDWLKRKHSNWAVHEPATIAAFLAIEKRFKSKNIFDLGSLYGYFSILSQLIFEDAKVTAFEMHPSVILSLMKNAGASVKYVHAAISDVPKSNVKFWLSGFNIYEEPAGGWENLATIPGAMKERGRNNTGRGFIRLDFTTIDEYCKTNNPPDLIKIDVEGYQAKALLGGLGTIERNRPVIIIELHDPEKLQRFGTTNKKTVQPLFDLGYKAYWCGNHRSPLANFKQIDEMSQEQERLSLMVFVP